jgi:hypothetical protein
MVVDKRCGYVGARKEYHEGGDKVGRVSPSTVDNAKPMYELAGPVGQKAA